jgi:hypothetical protein
MQNVNTELATAYLAALQPIGVPVFYNFVTPNLVPSDYILFRSIQNLDASTKSTGELTTLVTVEIRTTSTNVVNTTTLDSLANDVFQAIYTNTHFNLLLSSFQVVSTEIASDNTLNYTLQDGNMYIDRIITFRHHIFVES